MPDQRSQPPNVTQRFAHPTTDEGLINGPLKRLFINAVTEVVDVCSHLSKDVSFGLLEKKNGEGFLVEQIKTIRVHLTRYDAENVCPISYPNL